MSRVAVSFLAGLLMAGVSPLPAFAQAGQDPSQTLQALLKDEREFVWRADPLAATADGVHRYDDRLPLVTPAAQAARLQADRGFLRRLQAIDRAGLSLSEQVSHDLFAFMVGQRIELAEHREWRIPLNSDSGFHADVLFMHELAAPRTVADYERYIARLQALPRYFDENIANLRQGMADGFTLPAAVLDGVGRAIQAEQFARAEDCPLFRPFAAFPPTVPEAERARLASAGREAIVHAVIPAYAAFQRFFEREYRARARPGIAATQLPGGRQYYADLVRYYTTLPDATADSVHATGLAEVARIRAQMQAIVAEVGFQGDLAAFIAFLRTDPRFYAKSEDELLHQAAWLAKQADMRLPAFFGHLPRTPYGVRAVPAELAANYTGGRYNPGPLGSAGEYWVNTYPLKSRPLYVLPALTLHEAVPGHHLQGSLAREQAGVPAFRVNFYPHAFGEGWGLYAEKLGEEFGLYRTPYERFGRLTYEMWRASRLVVDTGMHAKGWSRQQALDFLAANTALSEHEIRTEVDRYIAWPGQALAYKTGELKILELRRRAEAELGPHFDIRAFHDAVLGNGGVTLPVLEAQVEAWLQRERAACAGCSKGPKTH